MFGLFKRSAKPTAAQVVMVKDLKQFGEELKQHRLNLLCHPNSAVRLLVEFFNSTSPRQDSGLTSMLAELKGDEIYRAALRELAVHLRQTGRDACGMNRTEFGQRVHDTNVFLGAVNNRFTKSVDQILVDESEEYQIFNTQATKYLSSHLDQMILRINALLKSQVVAEILEI